MDQVLQENFLVNLGTFLSLYNALLTFMSQLLTNSSLLIIIVLFHTVKIIFKFSEFTSWLSILIKKVFYLLGWNLRLKSWTVGTAVQHCIVKNPSFT